MSDNVDREIEKNKKAREKLGSTIESFRQFLDSRLGKESLRVTDERFFDISNLLLENINVNRYVKNRITTDVATYDKSYIRSATEYDACKNIGIYKDGQIPATDYAIACGVWVDDNSNGSYWTSTAVDEDARKNEPKATAYRSDGDSSYLKTPEATLGVVPFLRLDARKVADHLKKKSGIFTLTTSPDNPFPTISFGEFPKTIVSDISLDEFKGKAIPTGKKYFIDIDRVNGHKRYAEEYLYEDKKYALAKVLSHTYSSYYDTTGSTKANKTNARVYSNGQKAEYGDKIFTIEPLDFIISNWNSVIRDLNPEGTGANLFITLESKNIVHAMPFFFEGSTYVYSDLWANSTIRAYLNGLKQDKILDENLNEVAPFSEPRDFEGEGFLKEALIVHTPQITFTTNTQTRNSRIQRLNPDTTPEENIRQMTDTEKIKYWIDNGESVLLRGPSGIGKTERITTLYPNCIHLKLTNNMFPEKVVGSVNLQTGEELPPNFARNAILSCATPEEKDKVAENIQNIYAIAEDIYQRSKESDEKIVILLDELLNVKPAVQSLVYTLVLNKFIESGKGIKLPKNVVVVATGNQKRFSSVAEESPIPLEKRFDHILDMEPKVDEWIYEYAIPNNIHPSVTGYILSKKLESSPKNINYFYEEPEVGEEKLDKNGCRGKTNDPRGWTAVSQSLYNFEEALSKGKLIGKDPEDLLKTSLNTKLRDEWAEEFFDFYNNPTLSVEDILEGNYTEESLPTTINEKLATIAGLLSVDEGNVESIRNFIREYINPEYCAVFDLNWANGNVDRMEKIATLRNKDKVIKPTQPEFTPTEIKEAYPKVVNFSKFVDGAKSGERIGIACPKKWQAEFLREAMEKNGMPWDWTYNRVNTKGSTNKNPWDFVRDFTIFSNDQKIIPWLAHTHRDNIYGFGEVDFSDTLTLGRIREIESKLNADKTISLNDFRDLPVTSAMKVDSKWKFEYLMKALGKIRNNYIPNPDAWDRYKEKTIFWSNDTVSSNIDYGYPDLIFAHMKYDFSDIDFSGILTPEEIKDIKNKLASENKLKDTPTA